MCTLALSQEIHQVLMDKEETCHRTCFSLQLDGIILDNFTELKNIEDSGLLKHERIITTAQGAVVKVNGKEVIILGKANSDFNPDPGLFYQEGKYQYVSIQAGSGSAWVGVDCMLEKANADKFVGIKKDDVVTATGILHVNKGNMTLQPCTRDFRGSK